MVHMADPDSERYFGGDIDSELVADTWRWTGKRPTILVPPAAGETLQYSIDFALPDATLKQAGPVTLSFFVNDHVVDRVRYTRHGRYTFKKRIPAEWIRAEEHVTLAAETDKPLGDRSGKPLGFILVALGLEQAGVEQQ